MIEVFINQVDDRGGANRTPEEPINGHMGVRIRIGILGSRSTSFW